MNKEGDLLSKSESQKLGFDLNDKRMKSFCRDLARRVQRYYADEEHRKEFEEWYFQEYGKQYKWKKMKDVLESQNK